MDHAGDEHNTDNEEDHGQDDEMGLSDSEEDLHNGHEEAILESALDEFYKQERTIDRTWLCVNLWEHMGLDPPLLLPAYRFNRLSNTDEEMSRFEVEQILPAQKSDQPKPEVTIDCLHKVSLGERNKSQGHTLEIALSSFQQFEVSPIKRIRHGPMAGYHALYIKTLPRFSKFLELSRELRNLIFSFLVKRDSKIFLNSNGRRGVSEEENFGEIRLETLTPGLLTVNKQVHDEAIEILYGQNFFSADFPNLDKFVRQIGGNARACIRRLELWMDYREPGRETYPTNLLTRSDQLAKLSRLKELRLVFHDNQLFNYYRISAAKLFFRQARKWLAEVAQIRGTEYDALKLITTDFIPGPDGLVKEEQLKAVEESFRADLKRYIDDPALALDDELDEAFEKAVKPRWHGQGLGEVQFISWEFSRWEALEHFRNHGKFPLVLDSP